MNRRQTMATLVACVMAMGVMGCQRDGRDRDGGRRTGRAAATQPAEARHADMWQSVNRAVAVLHPTQGNNVRGTVHFQERGRRVQIRARVEGLQPNSEHGFHIHQYGDCSAPDATSAGDHYNPEGHRHGGPQQERRHGGDLGNLRANAQGIAELELTVDNITIAGTRNPIIGRAVIVHANPDKFDAQPSGDAGARIACGVIGVANPQTQPQTR